MIADCSNLNSSAASQFSDTSNAISESVSSRSIHDNAASFLWASEVDWSNATSEKKRLFAVTERMLGPARERREKLAADPDYVEDVLSAGARYARGVAREVMADVREACGLVTAKDTSR